MLRCLQYICCFRTAALFKGRIDDGPSSFETTVRLNSGSKLVNVLVESIDRCLLTAANIRLHVEAPIQREACLPRVGGDCTVNAFTTPSLYGFFDDIVNSGCLSLTLNFTHSSGSVSIEVLAKIKENVQIRGCNFLCPLGKKRIELIANVQYVTRLACLWIW